MTGFAAAVLMATAGCTGDSTEPGAEPLPSRSVDEGATLHARPVPLTTAPTRTFGGRLSKQRVSAVERQVGELVERYFEAAYLGEYPRRDFEEAFGDFAQGADSTARADGAMLTNFAVADRVESVAPIAKRLRLEVLAQRREAAGATAHVRLVFREERVTGRTQRVSVSGRLLLTPDRDGGWQVFGYDIARAAAPTGRGSR